MRLTEEDILEINEACPEDQGVFKEAGGIPNNIKEHVIYTRYQTGYRGGSCFDNEDTVREHVEVDPPYNKLEVLDLVLKKIRSNVTPSEVIRISELLRDNDDDDYGYYGSYTHWTIEFIVLRDLYHLLDILDEEKN